MQHARAELVDSLPAGRSRALVCLGGETVLLVRKGNVDGEQTCEEMTELLQAVIDEGEGGQEWPPPTEN